MGADSDFRFSEGERQSGLAAELEHEGFDDAQEVGRGGFGVVYRCHERVLNRSVAIKVLSTDINGGNLARFLREEHAMGTLSGHPNIVNVFHVGTTAAGHPYIVMPFYAGGSYEQMVKLNGPLPPAEVLRIGVKTAGALAAAHHLEILHRDVKPANILRTDYNEPQLCDFGIARMVGGFQTTRSSINGSPGFTAPEIFRGEDPSVAADIYSLGATMFCLLTGHAAFARRSGERMIAQFVRITTEPIPDLRQIGIPEDISACVEIAMAPEPADRFSSAVELGETLREVEERAGLQVDDMALPFTTTETSRTVRSVQVPSRTVTTPNPALTLPPSAITKFLAPRPTRTAIERRQLLELLRDTPRRRLTLIHAPAGYGKTTLVAQWAKTLQKDRTDVAWLSVDADDNDTIWFLAHVIEAIRHVRPTIARSARQVLEEHAERAERYVLTSLINDVHAGGSPLVLVLEDWHYIGNTHTASALKYLLENGPEQLSLVVTSRNREGLPLNTMRLRDELEEIDHTRLRFTDAEARSFLLERARVDISEGEAMQLSHAVEGWPAALHLAALSIHQDRDPATLLRGISGGHPAISEYLTDTVVSTLPAPQLSLLEAMSITGRVSGALASALTGDVRAESLLEEAERQDMFVTRVDGDTTWYRCNPLLADYLRRRLEQHEPDRLRTLHYTASQWYADRQMLGEAVHHALASGNEDFAADLIEAETHNLIGHSRMATLLSLAAKIPAPVTARHPHLQIAVARANVSLHRLHEAEETLRKVDDIVARDPLPAEDTRILRIEAGAIRAIARINADHIEGVTELVTPCLETPDTLPPWVVAVAANAASFVDIYTFNLDEARQRQRWAEPYHLRAQGSFGAIYGHCYSGIAASEQLDITAAERSFRDALVLAESGTGPHSHASQLAGALLGALLYEKDQLDEADTLLKESYQLGFEVGAADVLIATYVTGARLKMVRGDLEGASNLLRLGAEAAQTLSLPRLAACVDNERARSQLPGGPIPQISRSRRSWTSRPATVATVTEEINESALIRRMMRHPATVGTAHERADSLVQSIRVWQRPRAELHAEVLLAACQFATGDVREAKSTLVSVLDRCARHGLWRVVLDAGEEVDAILSSLRSDLDTGRWRPEWPDLASATLARMSTIP
ncbi:serine/threonine-protein kinase [Rhodococcus sp. JS3073]|uniref:serine/threonine-protein kinase n=1 Tax=Rhodococcus sp. JS3073 TaxID=3002901 RepID=UPI002285E51A|nr:serine/threonine-protein kinase [Rhodococcus sp. JS3073]WAM12076.1 protein kinase [Rhodococcus sp. JS3073]